MEAQSENVSVSKSCCQVESIATIDERGQMVLPKELREKAGIKPGDKFAVSTCENDGKVCCLLLVPLQEFSSMVKSIIGKIAE
jgi:antitoxin PrlF